MFLANRILKLAEYALAFFFIPYCCVVVVRTFNGLGALDMNQVYNDFISLNFRYDLSEFQKISELIESLDFSFNTDFINQNWGLFDGVKEVLNALILIAKNIWVVALCVLTSFKAVILLTKDIIYNIAMMLTFFSKILFT